MDTPFSCSNGFKPTRRNLIVARANQLLNSHPHFHGRCGTIEICQDEEGHLVLKGKLPNYYLKQIAQECLRKMEVPIQNEIRVVGEFQVMDPRWPR